MFNTLRRLWQGNRLLLVATCVAALLTLFFAVRTVMFTIYWSDPAHRDQYISGWMTPRYVGHSWQVPPEVIATALGMTRDGSGRRITLADIAENQGTDMANLAEQLQAAIAAYRLEERNKERPQQ